jgi:hypothetical protein
MFIPPVKIQEQLRRKAHGSHPVCLRSDHIWIEKAVAREVFGDNLNVYVVYYPEQRALMLAPVSDDVFKQLHKASQQMLKNRNLEGDKTIAVHDILIDNQVDRTDRALTYELQPGLGILKVAL